jgi:hypothetical protein
VHSAAILFFVEITLTPMYTIAMPITAY